VLGIMMQISLLVCRTYKFHAAQAATHSHISHSDPATPTLAHIPSLLKAALLLHCVQWLKQLQQQQQPNISISTLHFRLQPHTGPLHIMHLLQSTQLGKLTSIVLC
jgi:hypothetical protein